MLNDVNSANAVLQQLHNALKDLGDEKRALEINLKDRLSVYSRGRWESRTYSYCSADTSSLTLRWTPGLGHICHVKGRDANLSRALSNEIRTVSASKTTRSFYLPEWSSLGGRIDQIKLQIRAEEQRVFQSLRLEV